MSEENIPRPWLENLPDDRPATLTYPENETAFDQMLKAAKEYPDSPAIIFQERVITWSELVSYVKRFAVALQEHGFKKGDKLSVMLPNTPHIVIAHYATLALGGIVVQTNPLYTPYELEHILNDSGATWMAALDLLWEKVEKVKPKTKLKNVVYCGIPEFLPEKKQKLIKIFKHIPVLNKKVKAVLPPKPIDFSRENVFKFMDFLSDESKFKQADINPKEDLAVFQYTGGTTGLSKGAMLTHYNLVSNAIQVRNCINSVPDGDGSLLTVLPLFHSFGLTACMNLSIQLKIPMIMVPKFDAHEVLSLIERYKVTFFPGVPTMYVALIQALKKKKYDMSSIVASISGGAPLPLEVIKEFKEVAGAQVVEGYGLSEASPVTHVNPIGGKVKAGSIGMPVADTDVKIVDTEDDSKILGIGEVGEICVKGPQVFKGYWNREEETKNTLRNGWLHTGDIGKMDEDGYFYIVDRKKDMIIVSGYNVYPREVEEVLYKHPAVLEAAVAGVKHPVKGEIVKAWVVLKPGMTATEEEIIKFTKEYVAPYKAPKEVEFREELPKSMIGKIIRRILVEEENKKHAQNQ